jgi:PAS domain-containing protein
MGDMIMDDRKKIEQEVIDSLEYAQSIIDTVRDPLIVLDGDLRVISASKSFYKVFKVTAQDTEKQLIYSLGNGQWDIPKLRELLEKIIPNNASFDDYLVEHDFQNIGRRVMMLNARRIPRPPEKMRIILLAIENVTASKLVEQLHNKIKKLAIFTEESTGRELKVAELKENLKNLESEIMIIRSQL